MKEEDLLEIGFRRCIFAPIYITRFSYYLGDLDWSLTEVVNKPKWWQFWKKEERYKLMNNLNWNEAKMILGETIEDGVFKDWFTGNAFSKKSDVIEYCKKNNFI